MWEELFPDDVFAVSDETSSHSAPALAEIDMATQIIPGDFESVHSKDSMSDLASGSDGNPDQSLASVEVSVSGTHAAPSSSNSIGTGSVTPVNVPGIVSEDTVSDSGTVVHNQPKKRMEMEPPSYDLQSLQFNSNKDNTGHGTSEAGSGSQASVRSKASSIARKNLQIQKELLMEQEKLDNEEIELKRKELEHEKQKKEIERKKKLLELKTKERLLEETMENGSHVSAVTGGSLLQHLGMPKTANEATNNSKRCLLDLKSRFSCKP